MTHFAGENWNGSHLPNAGAVYNTSEVPFPQIWNQEGAAAYNEIIGFQDLGEKNRYPRRIDNDKKMFAAIWPRSQVGNFVSQRLSSPRTALTPSNSSSNPSTSATTKKTRRRVASMAQRRAANIRERRRMFNLNEGKLLRNYLRLSEIFLSISISNCLSFRQIAPQSSNIRIREAIITDRDPQTRNNLHPIHDRTSDRPAKLTQSLLHDALQSPPPSLARSAAASEIRLAPRSMIFFASTRSCSRKSEKSFLGFHLCLVNVKL
jgi:hypothetical protein